jgi:fructosamine-3-kinase
MWNQISEQISQTTGKPFTISDRRSVSGGCINQGYRLSGENQSYFVKINQASRLEMFRAEALGLKQMLATQTIRVPKQSRYHHRWFSTRSFIRSLCYFD